VKKWKGYAAPHNTRNRTSLTFTDVKLKLRKKTKQNNQTNKQTKIKKKTKLKLYTFIDAFTVSFYQVTYFETMDFLIIVDS